VAVLSKAKVKVLEELILYNPFLKKTDNKQNVSKYPFIYLFT